ncbi:MAG: hypothetical protein WAV74_23350, partial [Anaerolineae bacterium]
PSLVSAPGRRRQAAPPIAGGDVTQSGESWTTTTRTPLLSFLFLGLLSLRAAEPTRPYNKGHAP